MIANAQELDKVLWENYRDMVDPEGMFGVDNNQDRKADFEKADLRVLIYFTAKAKNRVYSYTLTALTGLIKKRRDNVFVDAGYFPDEANMPLLDRLGVPYMFGNVSHAPWWDYDVICISHSIQPESLNLPISYVKSGIPLSHEERMEKDIPLILYGGASAVVGSILFGEISPGKHSLVDMAMFGRGEGLFEEVINILANWNEGLFTENSQLSIKLPNTKRAILEYFRKDFSQRQYLMQPAGYRYIKNTDNFTLKSIAPIDPEYPEKVQVHRIDDNSFPGYGAKIFNLNGMNCDTVDVPISSGCSGYGACSFCLEGTVDGGWKEKTLEDLTADLVEAKKMSAAESCGFFSFNSNYYYRYLDLLSEVSGIFHHAAFVNMRGDVLAADDSYLKMAKVLRMAKLSIAVEGIGDRVRNQILNKNFSFEQLKQAFSNACDHKMLTVKMGMIVTGAETPEDFKVWLAELDELIRIKNNKGSNLAILTTHTPLTIYDHLPLRWMPREMARQDYYGEKTYLWYIEELRKRNIKPKFHNPASETFISQFILDIGAAGTALLVDLSLAGVHYDSSFRDADKQVLLGLCKKHNIQFEDIMFKERPADFVFPTDNIEVVPERTLKEWREMYERQDFRREICLKTPAHPKGKCHSCGTCKHAAQINHIVNRPLSNEHTLTDVIEKMTENHHVSTVRVVCKSKSQWDFYDKRALSFFIASQFLRQSPELLRAYYTSGKNTVSWVSDRSQCGWYGGYFVFDMMFKERITAEHLKPLFEGVNAALESAQVVSAYDTGRESLIKNTGSVGYLGVISGVTMNEVKNRMDAFDGMILTAAKIRGLSLMTTPEYMPEIRKDILFAAKGKEVLTYMYLPRDVAPFMVLASVFGKTPEWAYSHAKFTVLDAGLPIDAVCSCGRHLTYSEVTNSYTKTCPFCLGQKTLYRMTSV